MSNVFQTCLEDFKLKIMVVEPKTAQPVEPDEEPVDFQLNRSRGAEKHFLYSKTVVQLVEVRSRLNLNRSRSGQGVVKVRSRGGQGPVKGRSRSSQGAVEVQQLPVKH